MGDVCLDYWDAENTNLERDQYRLLLFACPFSFYIASLRHCAFERAVLTCICKSGKYLTLTFLQCFMYYILWTIPKVKFRLNIINTFESCLWMKMQSYLNLCFIGRKGFSPASYSGRKEKTRGKVECKRLHAHWISLWRSNIYGPKYFVLLQSYLVQQCFAGST